MRGRLYLLCFASMAAGIVAVRFCDAPAMWALLALLLLSLAGLATPLKRRALILLVPVACSFLGSLLMLASGDAVRGGLLAARAGDGVAVTVLGRVVSPATTGGGKSSFFLQVGEARLKNETYTLGERVYVQAEGALKAGAIFPGSMVEAHGRLARPQREVAWLADNGAGSVLRCAGTQVTRQPEPAGLVSRSVATSRQWIALAYERVFDRRVAGFLQGVSLSKTDRMDQTTLADLRACGLGHLVAMAGLHVGSAAILVLAIAGVLGLGHRWRFVLACLAALAVLSLSNFRLSAMRATIMAGACFAGSMLGRRYNPLIGVSLAGMAMLCANPRAICDSSFQYSFAAALGIVLVASRRGPHDRRSKAGLAVAVCAGAQLGILPLIVIKGEPAPVSALLANLLVVWLVGAILLAGWATALLTAVSMPVARVASVMPAALARYVMAVASTCARLPGAGLHMGALSAAALVFYAAALVMFASRRRGSSLLKPAVALGVSAVLVLFGCFPLVQTVGMPRMTVLDVGEGDAALLQAEGTTVLVDGGPDPNVIVAKLRSRGVSHVDLMVASHPHADHCAGLVQVMRSMPVGRLLEPGEFSGVGGAYEDLLALAARRGVPVTVAAVGQSLSLGARFTLEVLFAPSRLPVPPENLNDCSIVAMAEVEGARVLFTGDIEADAQQTLFHDSPSMACDVIKVPHQGAANAATAALLDASRPAVATISVGRDNEYGHPSKKCLDLLASRGVKVARTDLSGDIVITMGNGRIGMQTSRR